MSQSIGGDIRLIFVYAYRNESDTSPILFAPNYQPAQTTIPPSPTPVNPLPIVTTTATPSGCSEAVTTLTVNNTVTTR